MPTGPSGVGEQPLSILLKGAVESLLSELVVGESQGAPLGVLAHAWRPSLDLNA